MKKLLILLTILLLVPMGLRADDYLDSLPDYARQIRRNLGASEGATGYVSDTTANEMLRLAIFTVNSAIRGVKTEMIDTTIFQINSYTLDTTIVGISSIRMSFGDTLKALSYAPISTWRTALVELLKTQAMPLDKRPFLYDYIDGTLLVFPTPVIGGDTLKIITWRKVPSITTIDSLSIMPQKYRSAVLFHATYMIAKGKQHPMTGAYATDYQEAIRFLGASVNTGE